MRRLLDKARYWIAGPVSKTRALAIARKSCTWIPPISSMAVCDNPPNVYCNAIEPCWWIRVPWGDERGFSGLRSSRVVAVGKLTGKVHYDGSAGDEG
jgi:hypothetical protein